MSFLGQIFNTILLYKLITGIFIFTGVTALWWAGWYLFDNYFLPNTKLPIRITYAAIIGIVILAITHQIVPQLG